MFETRRKNNWHMPRTRRIVSSLCFSFIPKILTDGFDQYKKGPPWISLDQTKISVRTSLLFLFSFLDCCQLIQLEFKMIKSTIALLIIVAAGVFQTTGACDENHDYMDHQALAFRNTQPRIYDPYYRYANTPFFIPYYYNYPPSSRVQEPSGIILKHLFHLK